MIETTLSMRIQCLLNHKFNYFNLFLLVHKDEFRKVNFIVLSSAGMEDDRMQTVI